MTFRASSTEVLRKLCGRLAVQNDRALKMWEATGFPLSAPFRPFGFPLWPFAWWSTPEPEYETIPEIPEPDPWEKGGEVDEKVGDILAEEFAPIFESLWKAAFVQDGPNGGEGRCARQLREQGYKLDQLEATRMGFGPLRELMGRHRHQGNLTQMGGDDLMAQVSPITVRVVK